MSLTLPYNLPGERLTAFWDFDDVLNVHGNSNNLRKKHSKLLPGHMRKHDVYAEEVYGGKGWFSLLWSSELTRKLNLLKETHPHTWVWLTTWVNHTKTLDKVLNLNSDFTAEWNAYPTARMTDDELDLFRDKAKLDTVLAFHRANPATPFLWVDDSATKLWSDKFLVNPDTPHLVLTPDFRFGVSLADLDAITAFVSENS